MSYQSANNKRIAKNTLMLYVRMLFGMLVSLFTSRVILQTLGVEDYGVYYTMIETCKLQGYSVLEYLEAFFTAVIKGRTDYENLMPAAIGIGGVT